MDQKRIREFARGWNDAQARRACAARCEENALAYVAGYSCGAPVTASNAEVEE